MIQFQKNYPFHNQIYLNQPPLNTQYLQNNTNPMGGSGFIMGSETIKEENEEK